MDWSNVFAARNDLWISALATARKGHRLLVATSLGSSGWGAGTAIDGLLGVALTLRGASIEYLLCDGALPACMECDISWYTDEARFARDGPTKRHCQSCFTPANSALEALGLRVNLYSHFLKSGEIADAERFARDIPSDQIAAYKDNGLAIGEHALAGALRFYARATLADRHADVVLRRYLVAAILTAQVARRVFQQRRVECVIAHHGIYVPQGIVCEVARAEGIRVVTWHTAYRKRAFIFSHSDTYHHTMMSEPTSLWEKMQWGPELERRIVDYLNSRWSGHQDWIRFVHRPETDPSKIRKRIGLRPDIPTVGLLTNVMWDAQLHYPANAFPNMRDWLVKTVRYFSLRRDLQLVIRIHPAEVKGTLPSRQRVLSELNASFDPLPDNVFVVGPESRISTYALMNECNAALIYGTKTGIELLSMGIPTIVAGEAWVRSKGITFDASTEGQYLALLDRLPFDGRLPAETVNRARMYAYHFFFRRMIPLNMVEPNSGYPPFTIKISSLEQLRPGADQGLDVICNGILTRAPFVYPDEELESRRAPGR